MKILIISHHTFPKQGPRPFRTAELSEELARQGHEVTVYAVTGDYDYSQYSKETGVIVKPIKMRIPVNIEGKGHRYNMFDKFLWHSLHRIAEWPLIELKYRVAEILAKDYDYDLLITIAVPHTIHWGAALAKTKNADHFPKRWIADCGDPFMLNPFGKPMFYFAKEEKRWCRLADYIAVPTQQSIEGYYPEFKNKIKVIPQGFNQTKTPTAEYEPNLVPTFAYAGFFYPGKRDPYQFLEYLATLDTKFRCVFFIGSDISQKYHDMLGEKLIVKTGWKRKDIIYELGKMDFLINIPNKGSKVQVPSKLIDYAIAGRPVLNVETDFAQEKEFQAFLREDYSCQMVMPELSQYDIRTVAGQFLGLVKQ